ncbi:MAG: phenylalanine--tRNA ligase subunit alpha [Candidatus Ryanbacteria bacterium RIFCSPHIGHO2_02_FULL_48_12]|uniref:Phenylalanine--tRNA ligase alpha subunit n=1 Tax=Candidatus Ryanbacteria bacterium RIFCSPHIGHO2_01_FULL_48_27 TaxID=1802115 RepID=A0A1G2G6J9_9BACT|nr:MAG: phenylalanine--tRNA ligase subunit alpha [Candidatus Ryanbacteria bacterium RIFCSPHIGHO2_01_FULL_48_27]OGZ49455.1 MAG: phenylalanine--tRNA ligase subunit alpha [Candidatus Ryanbacteria bacterium RIFCSPHIGHO2_02_FULL_48_12]
MHSLEDLRAEAERAIKQAGSLKALRDAEVAYLGRSGKLTQILKTLKDLPEDKRRTMGAEANETRKLLELLAAERTASLKREEYEQKLKLERIDITRPGKRYHKGGLHPLTIIRRDIERIFGSMGFAVAEGPEVETEFYNFDALNIPADHPARDMWDTFWIKNPKRDPKAQRLLLRTHTSPVQVRYIQKHAPPFRIIAPGRVFRYEATDASHEIQFYQLEGLMVGRDISLANFKQVMQTFLGKLFGKEMKVRLRPSYFPFVEPGAEVDMSCVQCGGHGCSVCKHTGWVEIAGAGMVHPKVFQSAGLNPKDWQGFAFGFGIDRVAMMKYKIPDIRMFYQNDIRFLRQF